MQPTYDRDLYLSIFVLSRLLDSLPETEVLRVILTIIQNLRFV